MKYHRRAKSTNLLLRNVSVLLPLLFLLTPTIFGCSGSSNDENDSNTDGTNQETQVNDPHKTNQDGTKPQDDKKPQEDKTKQKHPDPEKRCYSHNDCDAEKHERCTKDPKTKTFSCTIVSTKDDGEPCANDSECTSGTCFTTWKGGYCTRNHCKTSDDCSSLFGSNNQCLQKASGETFCVRVCHQDSECREGYECEPVTRSGLGACLPIPTRPDYSKPDQRKFNCRRYTEAPPNAEVATVYLKRGSSTTVPLLPFPFKLDRKTESFHLLSFVQDVTKKPVTALAYKIAKKNNPGDFLDLYNNAGGYANNTMHFLTGGLYSAFLLPNTPAQANFVEPGGEYVISFAQTAEFPLTICTYITEKTFADRSNSLDLNVYLVGVKDANGNLLTTETAKKEPHLQEALNTMNRIYKQQGIQIGTIRYLQASDETIAKHSIFRTANLGRLVGTSQIPTGSNPSYDDMLSVNIFLVRAIADNGVLGISSGIPGFPGTHQSSASGVVFSTSDLHRQNVPLFIGGETIRGDKYTGQIIAHEVGHFLGLFHSSEATPGTFDPLEDTPQCDQTFMRTRNYFRCDDRTNLMFPLSGFTRDYEVELTGNQGYVIKRNPLTKYKSEK